MYIQHQLFFKPVLVFWLLVIQWPWRPRSKYAIEIPSPIPFRLLFSSGICFDRLVSKISTTQSLDLVEDSVQVITSVPAKSELDCAGRCLHSDTQNGAHCRSYKFTSTADNSTRTCTLRSNAIKDESKVKWLEERLFIAYGKRRDVCDNIR